MLAQRCAITQRKILQNISTIPALGHQAQSGAQMTEELEHTETPEKARKARRTATRRSLQKGGVLYASEVRNMVV